jgi:hypothetical protein
MITDVDYMLTMTKFTTTDTNIPVICFHLVEIALHSDLSATPSHVRRSNSLPFRCSCAWPAVEMGIEPPASAARPLNDAQSHLRGMKQALLMQALMLSNCEGGRDCQGVGARLRAAHRCLDRMPADSTAASLAIGLEVEVELCLAKDSCWRRQ